MWCQSMLSTLTRDLCYVAIFRDDVMWVRQSDGHTDATSMLYADRPLWRCGEHNNKKFKTLDLM